MPLIFGVDVTDMDAVVLYSISSFHIRNSLIFFALFDYKNGQVLKKYSIPVNIPKLRQLTIFFKLKPIN